MNLRNSRRKKHFISRRIQGRIISRIAGYWLLYHFVLWHGLFVFRYAQYRLNDGGTSQSLSRMYQQFCHDHLPLLVCAGLLLPLFMLDFVRMTHRIAGPLVRFRGALQDLAQGKTVPKVELRKGDLLTEFEADFNRFLDYYNHTRPAGETAKMSEAEAAVVANVTAVDADDACTHDCACSEHAEVAEARR